jgi:SAM-dependent methyltransferase
VSLRERFNEDAELYDRARPGYPGALFDHLAQVACIGPNCRVLEIGCGTGQATLPLAERGCEIVCVELGASMAAVAQRKLARFPLVRVEVAAFEDWPLPNEPFDMVFAATAFHWIDPSVRVRKAADALRRGGALATIATHHVAGGDEAFFADAQTCYERWDPATPPGLRLQPSSEIPFDSDDLNQSDRFGPAAFRRYEWEVAYTTSSYIDTLLTYSGHRALPPEARAGLLGCIADLIESRYGGRIRKRYMSELRVAHKRPSA